MSKITHNIMGAIDCEKVKNIREENFQSLYSRLQHLNGIEVKKVEGSFTYPFYRKGGLEIKKKLGKNGSFVASLWPTVFGFGEMAIDYSENILPLPCDQRYTVEDIATIVDELERLI